MILVVSKLDVEWDVRTRAASAGISTFRTARERERKIPPPPTDSISNRKVYRTFDRYLSACNEFDEFYNWTLRGIRAILSACGTLERSNASKRSSRYILETWNATARLARRTCIHTGNVQTCFVVELLNWQRTIMQISLYTKLRSWKRWKDGSADAPADSPPPPPRPPFKSEG